MNKLEKDLKNLPSYFRQKSKINISKILPKFEYPLLGKVFGLWVQGCLKHCSECVSHKEDINSIKIKLLFDTQKLAQIVSNLAEINGIVIYGGEPLLQYKSLSLLAKEIKRINPGKFIVIYTGYMWEEINNLSKRDKALEDLIQNIDLLIDGEYNPVLYSPDDPFRGSANQRLIFFNEKLQILYITQKRKLKRIKNVYIYKNMKIYQFIP